MNIETLCIRYMKSKFILLAASGLLIFSCNTKKPFYEEKTDNPDFYANTVFKSYEDLSSPRFKALKEKYPLGKKFLYEFTKEHPNNIGPGFKSSFVHLVGQKNKNFICSRNQ